MTDLSPQAQAVMDAFLKAPMGQSHVDDDLIAIGAALRAAADKTCPQSRIKAQNDVRYKLLAIAAELEGSDA